jgi:hypothetical protein
MDKGPLVAPPTSDKRSSSRLVAFSINRARSLLLGKSESSNYRVADFFRTMTSEQKIEYDARQPVFACNASCAACCGLGQRPFALKRGSLANDAFTDDEHQLVLATEKQLEAKL